VSEAADQLYGASHKGFVEERKRLAAAAKAAGDKEAAKEIAKLARPTLSAWLVNQLWRRAREDLDALFAASARLRKGDFAASAAQRAALTRLRAAGAEILKEDGHAASDATLARTQTTLQALAAAGSFDPDPPGQLVADRDPPGFDALDAEALPSAPERPVVENLKREEKVRRLEKARREVEARSATVDELRGKLEALRVELERAEEDLSAARTDLAQLEAETDGD
jgi:hypothetical protein